MYFVGFDPGGAHAFGWAVLSGSGQSLTLSAGGVGSSAFDAVSSAAAALPEPPAAVGIDAPLFWALTGDRRADSYVRRFVCSKGGFSGTVGHVNSLRGACLVGGAVAAKLSSERWPAVQITESHPKALVRVSPEAAAYSVSPELVGHGHHLRDAALGAYAAVALFERWPSWRDLALLDADRLSPLGVSVAYWFPGS